MTLPSSSLFHGKNNVKTSESQIHLCRFRGVISEMLMKSPGLMPRKSQIAIGEFFIPCNSPCIVESKSFKLYVNSFYQTPYESIDDVQTTLQRDLSKCVQQEIDVKLIGPQEYHQIRLGTCREFASIHWILKPILTKLIRIYLNILPKSLKKDSTQTC